MKMEKGQECAPAKSFPERLRARLRACTPMARLAAYEDWIEQRAGLMVELGFAADLDRLRANAANVRADLESSGGCADPKTQLNMAGWQAEQLKFVLAVALVEQRRRAASARASKAKDGISKTHDWPRIAKRVAALRAAGVSDREMAAEIERLEGVPKRTFTAWRKRQNGN